ncbi:MAG: Iron-sulfur cluster regulator IscR [uncultured Thiotrichaceae bacterium]|uniref:Iron-sulfur cluster regulator IscR n=1 Tax=uncultured Thiotrichaceae bacterium TaxID=298394 RepID=A0A6S6TA65_9GAMM|nr:MAG: Iron-sulfur cluster regulator IscR [uncultured Thiotrichaceae bacterium]
MKLTTKGRYAVTAMLDLALHNGGQPVSLAEISERQDISLSYLEQLFSKLRRAGLVTSMRGPGGGYQLNGEPESIVVSDIIAAVDESVDATRCGGMSDCQDNKRCLTHDLWSDLSDQIRTFLSDITLADMTKRRGVKQTAERQNQKVEFVTNSTTH